MEKYVVKLSHIFSNIVEVEAENSEEAMNVAAEQHNNKEIDTDIFYEGTLGREHWRALTVAEFEELKAKIKESLPNNQEENNNSESNNIIAPNIITP